MDYYQLSGSLLRQCACSEIERDTLAAELKELKSRYALKSLLHQNDYSEIKKQLAVMKAVNANAIVAIDNLRAERQALIKELHRCEEMDNKKNAELRAARVDCLKKDMEISNLRDACVTYIEKLQLEEKRSWKFEIERRRLDEPNQASKILICIFLVGFMIGVFIFLKMFIYTR